MSNTSREFHLESNNRNPFRITAVVMAVAFIILLFLAMMEHSAGVEAIFPLMGIVGGGIRYDAPADDGAGGGGTDPEPAGGDDPGGGEGPDTSPPDTDDMDDLIDLTDSMSTPDEEYEEPEPVANDDPAQEDPSASPQDDNEGDDDDPAQNDLPDQGDDEVEYNDEYDPNDTVEVDGENYFYHPKEHAPDGQAQGNVYKSRDDMEMAWPHKVGRVKELMESLQEKGKDVGAVDLPDWLPDPEDPNALEGLMDVEKAIEWNNDELRNHSSEADRLISHLTDREKRVTQEHERTTKQTELEEKVNETTQQVNNLIDDLGIVEQAQQARSLQDLRDAAVEARDNKIAEELKPMVKEFNDYKKDSNARLDDDNYADNLIRKREAIEKRRQELEGKYNDEYLSPFEQAIQLEQEAAELEEGTQDDGVSEQQRVENMNESFIDLQQEKQGDHPMFMSSDSAGVDAFRNWAVQRAEKFGGLQKTYQWNKALKAFDQHVEERRAELRKKKVEQANQREEKNKNIPKYGDQERIKKKDMPEYEKDQAELADLAAQTDAEYA